jgi:hypothetical protein
MKDAREDPHSLVGIGFHPLELIRYFFTRSNRYLINALQTRRVDPFNL